MIRGRGTDIACLQKGGRLKRVLGYTKSQSSPLMIHASIHDVDVVLETKPGVFSPKHVDAGTAALLSCLTFSPMDKVLDLGCGYGVVGVIAAKLIGPERVYLLDNDPAAVECATRNAARNGVGAVSIVLSDGFRCFDETDFSMIVCNPPYHADFAVP